MKKKASKKLTTRKKKTIRKKAKSKKKVISKKKVTRKVKKKKQSRKKLPALKTINLNEASLKEMKKYASRYDIKSTGNKPELKKRLKNFLSRVSPSKKEKEHPDYIYRMMDREDDKLVMDQIMGQNIMSYYVYAFRRRCFKCKEKLQVEDKICPNCKTFQDKYNAPIYELTAPGVDAVCMASAEKQGICYRVINMPIVVEDEKEISFVRIIHPADIWKPPICPWMAGDMSSYTSFIQRAANHL